MMFLRAINSLLAREAARNFVANPFTTPITSKALLFFKQVESHPPNTFLALYPSLPSKTSPSLQSEGIPLHNYSQLTYSPESATILSTFLRLALDLKVGYTLLSEMKIMETFHSQ